MNLKSVLILITFFLSTSYLEDTSKETFEIGALDIFTEETVAYDSFEEDPGSKSAELGYTADTWRRSFSDYFDRISNITGGTGGTISYHIASGVPANIHDDGTGDKYFFGADDLDDRGNDRVDELGIITFNNVNVNGRTNLKIKIALAQGRGSRLEADDYLQVYYAFDGDITSHPATSTSFTVGSYTKVAEFKGSGTDTDASLDGLGVTTLSTGSFDDYTFNISGTGNSLSVRIVIKTNGSDEEYLIDNMRVTADAAATDPVVTLSVSDNNPGEGDGSVTLTATADVAPSSNLTVNLSYSGTATGGGTDYTPVSSIVIPSGNTSNTATLSITSDEIIDIGETIIVDISSFSGVTATEGSPNQQTITIGDDDFEFNIKVFLEGPLQSNNMMLTTISGDVPKDPNDVYSGVQPEDAVASLPGDAVDWVEVELRTGTAAGDKVGTNRAGILKNNGSIVDKDGNAFTMSQADGTSYFIVIHHRNHLSVMSNAVVPPSSGTYIFDFTAVQANNYSGDGGITDGAIQVGSVFAMIAGDTNDDGDINGTDLINWRPQNGVAYSYGSNGTNDFNLDGVINAVDRNDFYRKNTGTSSQVPGT